MCLPALAPAGGAGLGSLGILASAGAEAHDVAVDGNGAAKLQFGTVTLIPDERLVLKDGRVVALTPKAFDLLVVLAENSGRLLTKEQLMQAVWPDTAVEESNLAYHVFAIRKALGENGDADPYIETVPKSGYRFVLPVVRLDAEVSNFTHARDAAIATIERSVAPPVVDDDPVKTRQLSLPAVRSLARDRWPPWASIAGALAVGALLIAGISQLRQPSVDMPPDHFEVPVTGRLADTGMFSISPDGRQLVFAAEGADGVLRLWARPMSTLQPVALPGSEVFTIIPPVVWSPDSRFVAFDPGLVLKRVGLEGGAAETLCELPGTAVGGSWSREGQILLGNALGALVRCRATRAAAVVSEARLPDGEAHLFPSFLSDGRRFIYLRVSRTNPESSGIYAGELGREPAAGGRRLITTGFGAAFVAGAGSAPGVIVFARDGMLFAQRLDERRLEVIGTPVRLADQVGSFLDGAFFSVSPTTLVYRAPEPDSQLTWFDRAGRELGRVGAPARFSGLALSPDGDRAVVTTHAPQGTANADLWLFELSRSANPRRVTFEAALEAFPVWSGNDRFVYGSRGGASGVYQQMVTGDRRLLFKSGGPEIPTSISSDGQVLLYTTITGSASSGDVWVRAADAPTAAATPFLRGAHDQSQAQLSPDNRWVAYVSNEGGPNEVFVTEFKLDRVTSAVAAGQSIRISRGGGFSPRWRRDGRELFYLTPEGAVMALDVDTTGDLRLGPQKRLFVVPGLLPEWGVAPDGMRFLFAVPLAPPPPFGVIRNWQALVPTPG